MKNKKLKYGLSAIACCLVLTAVFLGANSLDSQDERAYQDVMEAVSLRMKIGMVDAGSLRQELSRSNGVTTDDSLQRAVQKLSAQEPLDFSQYYTDDLAENYESTHEEKLEILNPTDITVASGVLEPHLIGTEDSSATEKQVKVSYVNWVARVYHQDETYTLALVFNKNTVVTKTVLENGIWKTGGSGETVKEFAPDTYHPVQGTFDTFQEALAFVEQMDAKTINPFV